MKRERRNAIVLALVRALGPRWSIGIDDALTKIREQVSADVSERELRDVVRWALARSQSSGRRFERRMLGHPRPRRRRPRLRLVVG